MQEKLARTDKENKNRLCSKACGGKKGLQTLKKRLNLVGEHMDPTPKKTMSGKKGGK